QAKRRRVTWLYQAARAEQDVDNRLEGAVIQQYRGIIPGQETGHHHARRIRVQYKVDGSTGLIVGLAKIDADRVAVYLQRYLDTERLITDAVAVDVISKRVVPIRHRRQRGADGVFRLCKDRLEPVLQLFPAKALAEFLQAALPKGTGCNHGFGVTAQQIGE